MQVFNLTIILISVYLHATSCLPAQRFTGDNKPNVQDEKKSFLEEYLTTLAEGGNNDQSTTTKSPQSSIIIPSRTLINENPTHTPVRQVPAAAAPQPTIQLTGADAIEDAINIALSIATAQQMKTTKIPKRKPPSTARSPHEINLEGNNINLNRRVPPASPYPTAIYTDPISLLGVPTTKAPWNNIPNPGISSQQGQLPGQSVQNVQIDPAIMQNYLSLMTPEDLLALQAYQYQDQLINVGQNLPPSTFPVGTGTGGLVPAVPIVPGVGVDVVTSTTEATPGEYLAGFFGSLAAANLGGMADNAFKLFASRHVQGFLTGLADQVTCQLGKNCKSPKINYNETLNRIAKEEFQKRVVKEA